MNRNRYVLTIFIFLINSKIITNDAPKEIITIEENLELPTNNIDKSNKELTDENRIEVKKEVDAKKDLIIIDDIPKEFNDWYGILSSEQGGLGWLMWSNTNSSFALTLLEKTNFVTNSPTLFNLTSKILMSRAQKPKENKMEVGDKLLHNNNELKYFKKKIRVLSEIGDTKSITKLVDNIPLEIKNSNFSNIVYELRQSDKDIPYLCKELQKKKFDLRKDIEKRKTLIACIIAKKKYNQAQLAIDLLENDSPKSFSYIQSLRRFLAEPSMNNLFFDKKKLESKNYKIISLSNYEFAEKVFSNDKLTFSKIIYDMKLYNVENQIESLEKLVSFGLYDSNILKTAYQNYYLNIKNTLDINNIFKVENDNSLDIRVSLFNLINNTTSDIERAKFLNLLWTKARELNIQKAIYSITSNSISSLRPTNELSWFTYPVTKALISNKRFEEAKIWLFFLTKDFRNRAVLDVNFCKMLLLLYVADINLKKSNDNIPDINFLLNVLNNSLEVKKESIYNLMITLKALNYQVLSKIWDSFYINEYNNFSSGSNERKTNLFLLLEDSVKNKNLAETSFIVIDLLNSSNKDAINYYYLYKSIHSLYNVGLKNYARNIGLEINMDL